MTPHPKDHEIVERPLSFYREARSYLSAIARSSVHSKCPEFVLLEKMINGCIFQVTNPRTEAAAETGTEELAEETPEETAEATASAVLDD
jgi:hypothetical protein